MVDDDDAEDEAVKVRTLHLFPLKRTAKIWKTISKKSEMLFVRGTLSLQQAIVFTTGVQ